MTNSQPAWRQWTQLGLTTVIWLLLAGVVGMPNLLRSEVK